MNFVKNSANKVAEAVDLYQPHVMCTRQEDSNEATTNEKRDNKLMLRNTRHERQASTRLFGFVV